MFFGLLLAILPNFVCLYLSDSPIWQFSPLKSHPDVDLIEDIDDKKDLFEALTFWGTKGSAFVIHDEPDKLCSINYLHPINGTLGKFWIGFTKEDSFKLKAYMNKRFEHLFDWCENNMRHSSILFHPKILKELGITYYYGTQMPGDIVITFSGALHMGYNLGTNLAEVSFGIAFPLTFGYHQLFIFNIITYLFMQHHSSLKIGGSMLLMCVSVPAILDLYLH